MLTRSEKTRNVWGEGVSGAAGKEPCVGPRIKCHFATRIHLFYTLQMGEARQAGDKGPHDDKPSDPLSDIKMFTESRRGGTLGRCTRREGLIRRRDVARHCDPEARNEISEAPGGRGRNGGLCGALERTDGRLHSAPGQAQRGVEPETSCPGHRERQ